MIGVWLEESDPPNRARRILSEHCARTAKGPVPLKPRVFGTGHRAKAQSPYNVHPRWLEGGVLPASSAADTSSAHS
jgi:hypothetical protein